MLLATNGGLAAKDLIPHRAGTTAPLCSGAGLGDLVFEGDCVFLDRAQRMIVFPPLAVVNRG